MSNLSNNMRGALLMMASMIAFTVNDSFMKALSGDVPLFQVIFLRGLATTALIALMAWYAGAFSARIERRDWIIMSLRSVAEVLAAFLFISALFNMPFANVSAILQALPLTVTLAGALFLGEAVGWKRIGAIIVGFVGVLMIVQPGTADFNVYSIYVILAVIVVTFRDLAARRLSSDVPSLFVAMFTATAVTAFAGLGSLTETWAVVDTRITWHLFGAAVFVVGGYLFSVMTMRVGEIGFVAPFRYTSLLAAIILGFVVFDEWPDSMTLIGSAIVVATGAFTLYRERQLGKATGPVPLRTR